MQKYTITSADCKSEIRVFSGNYRKFKRKGGGAQRLLPPDETGNSGYGLSTRVKVITVVSSVSTSWSPVSSICRR